MVVCVAIAAGLGVWQYDAWHRHRVDAARDLENKPAKALSTVMSGDSPFPARWSGQPVAFSGSWLGADTLFVSDRTRAGRTGYWVVTPVRVDGTASAMPVVRGWTNRPSAPAVDGPVEVTGWLQASEGDDAVDADPGDDVIPSMRVASLVAHVDEDLYSGFVIARVPDPTGAVEPVRAAKVPGVSGFTGLRNLLYGIEWWVFAGFAVFVWVRWCRDSLALSDDLATSDATGATEA
jgi:cytochrome oxidase assembly protein ShyY1